ncbi:NYN domain-containing protein [Corynebacterium sp. P7202]|uniref:NYN domain-containing protein n=1 Tax=Corynebacterium pygosceleis TaxID=2800406 RepID=A0A9Q4C9M7_9CORY|nr:NYN domain-containing protein [Corynebacterium pygosceleis]MCK7637146.1 NYN domain-containing protein [Corynebacterium pygosceleis]MCX7445049.1 NYN domain-containing protein [Corynebacterium pygosceleis]MCX7469439.1 NYN domain-containing protein [Corynebacterium pygosceleis]
MLERTQVFVDTSYLLASFYNSWETGARAQLEIDLPEVVAVLGTMIQNQLGQPIQRQMWYDGIPDSGPHRYQRALRTCDGVQLRAGQLIEWGERRTQKAVDTRLVADMVLTGLRGQCSDIVLVSGDADMLPGVQEATAAGLRVHLYGFGWDSMSSALRYACDSTTILDPREDFAECMQLQVLEGPLPPVVRTKPIGDAEPIEETGPTCVPNPRETPQSSPERAEQDEQAGGPHHRPTPGTIGHRPTRGSGDNQVDVPDPPTEDRGPGTTAVRQTASPSTHAGTGHPGRPGTGALRAPTATTAATPPPTPPVPPGKTPDTSASGGTEDTDDPVVRTESPDATDASASVPEKVAKPRPTPNPSMMAPRRKLRSRYVPLPSEVWASDGSQNPFDVGQQYASWWFDNAATGEQRTNAHQLCGGGLPPEIDRPLLQFACETLHEYTLTESQRVNLRDGFHSGIRGVLLHVSRR